MLSRLLLSASALLVTANLGANTLDFAVNGRQASVNGVDWRGVETGFGYFLDINDALSMGPYLTSTTWKISSDALHTKSTGHHREFGPEVRFFVPMETLNFIAGASYSLFSQGTARTEGGVTGDLGASGLRFKIGLGIPLATDVDLNISLIKGIQTVVLESEHEKARENLDDLALGLGLSF